MLAYAIWFHKPEEGSSTAVVFWCISGRLGAGRANANHILCNDIEKKRKIKGFRRQTKTPVMSWMSRICFSWSQKKSKKNKLWISQTIVILHGSYMHGISKYIHSIFRKKCSIYEMIMFVLVWLPKQTGSVLLLSGADATSSKQGNSWYDTS